MNTAPGCFHPYASNDKLSHQLDRKSSIPAWKQIRECQQGKKGRGLKDYACVSGQIGSNPSPMMAKNRDLICKSKTVNLLVNSCVANVHFVTVLPQKKGVIPNYCHNYTEIKYVKDVSCVGHSSSVKLVTNAATVAIDLPVGARLHQFWKKWENLGANPKVVTALRESYTLPFRFRPNLTRSPTVISNYVNPRRNLLEALY